MPNDSQFDDLGDGQEPNRPSAPLDKNQKIAAAGLAVFAILIIVLWTAQLRNNIYGPFNAPAGSSQLSQNQDQSETAKLEALKNKDTDGDGLSDYDELYIYHTSPYLADTDSDGIPDGTEVKNGTDPNCPQGRTCTGGLLDNTQASSTGATLLPDAGLQNIQNQSSALNNLLNQYNAAQPGQASGQTSGSVNSNSAQAQALKNLDAATLRQMLIQAGMQKSVLDKISDADLLKSYSEVLSSPSGR